MRNLFNSLITILLILFLAGCSNTKDISPTAEETQIPVPTQSPEITEPSDIAPPQPTESPMSGWSSTAGTKDELSFKFPGNWDGSSPLTFGEGEFVKDPGLPLGVTFRIQLQGNPEDLLESWGSSIVGVLGIITFTPTEVIEGPEVTIARVKLPTKIASGEGVTGQVAYIQRPNDVMEVMWFAPTDQWEQMQDTFSEILQNIELWRVNLDMTTGLQTMYVHDWQDPYPAWEDGSLMFASQEGKTGLVILQINEIADPVELLKSWSTDRLIQLELAECSLEKGDRMDTMSGQWESKTGECMNALGEKITYEVSFIPNKDRLLEMITFGPSETWQKDNEVTFKHLLGMMVDIR